MQTTTTTSFFVPKMVPCPLIAHTFKIAHDDHWKHTHN